MSDDLSSHLDISSIILPVAAFSIRSVSEAGILLKVRWTDAVGTVIHGDQGVELLLTPSQALHLGDQLSKHVQFFLTGTSSSSDD